MEQFEKGKKHSICQHCDKSFMYYAGNSNLPSHLKNSHPSLWPIANNGDKEYKTSARTKSIEFFYTTDS